MTVVRFDLSNDSNGKALAPATFLLHNQKYYYCIHPVIERVGRDLEAFLVRNCEGDPQYESVDNYVDWKARLFKNVYVEVYPTKNSFETLLKSGSFPKDLVFTTAESELNHIRFDPVSLFRAIPDNVGAWNLSRVDQVKYLDRKLRADPLGFFGLHYLEVDEATYPYSIGSAVFREEGNARKFVGIYTFAIDRESEKTHPSYIRASDLGMMIDTHEE